MTRKNKGKLALGEIARFMQCFGDEQGLHPADPQYNQFAGNMVCQFIGRWNIMFFSDAKPESETTQKEQ